MGVGLSLPVLGSARAEAGAGARGARPAFAERRLVDSYGRTVRDLRLSVTDRCNFRCVYCMDPGIAFAPEDRLLTAAELLMCVEACIGLGVERVRLTGGEPTVRAELDEVMRGVSALGVRDLSMTTNGSLATRERLEAWKRAGLKRITFSLDALTPSVFARMSRSGTGPERVVEAIGAALASGLGPVKVNAVVIRGMNEGEVAGLAALGRDMGFEMRFIEFMPLDSGRGWDASLVVSAEEILERASAAGRLVALGRGEAQSTSETYAFEGFAGSRVGIIAPVTRAFCGACSRLRITSDGQARACLFSARERDLRGALRDGSLGRAERVRLVQDLLLDEVWSKQAGHGISSEGFRRPARTMSAIGG